MEDRLIGTYSQGNDEQIVYSVNVSGWGTNPTDVTFKVYDVSSGRSTDPLTDVTATTMTGAATVVLDTITLPALKTLTAGKVYRVEIKFTAGGNIYEPYFKVMAEY